MHLSLQKPLIIAATPFIGIVIDAGQAASLLFQGRGKTKVRARSSVVEHYVDIVGVTSSNLVVPTIHPCNMQDQPKGRMRAANRRRAMKVKNSLRSLKQRHRDCQIVRRKGRVYVINKTQKKFKARQG